MLPKQEIYSKANELKVIIYNNDDFKFAIQESEKVSSECKLFLQPEWSKFDIMKDKIEISVIIPIYNEESTCNEIINKVKNINLVKEIIVVDDGSTDSTFEILKTIDDVNIIKHSSNIGKGAAVRTGLDHVKYDYVITQDADLEYYPEDYYMLAKAMNEYRVKVVYGSRWLDKPIEWSIHFLINQMISLFANVFNLSLIHI